MAFTGFKYSLKVLTPIDKEGIHKNGRVAFPEIRRYSFNDNTKVETVYETQIAQNSRIEME